MNTKCNPVFVKPDRTIGHESWNSGHSLLSQDGSQIPSYPSEISAPIVNKANDPDASEVSFFNVLGTVSVRNPPVVDGKQLGNPDTPVGASNQS